MIENIIFFVMTIYVCVMSYIKDSIIEEVFSGQIHDNSLSWRVFYPLYHTHTKRIVKKFGSVCNAAKYI